MRIAVAGGTGLVGRVVTAEVGRRGHVPVVLSRGRGVDLTTGRGLEAALADVERLIDVSNETTTSRRTSVRFFEAATQNLLAAGVRVGMRHHVALSIVGVDRVGLGYYAGKRRQEKLVLAGPVPASVLRATQFHEFAAQLLTRVGRAPVVPVPVMLTQPVAATEVAVALVDLVLGDPAGRAPDLAGPERLEMPDLVRRVLRARGSRRPVLPVRLPGPTGRAMAGGGLLPEGGDRGGERFDEWLRQSTGQAVSA